MAMRMTKRALEAAPNTIAPLGVLAIVVEVVTIAACCWAAWVETFAKVVSLVANTS